MWVLAMIIETDGRTHSPGWAANEQIPQIAPVTALYLMDRDHHTAG